jgi:molybdenum cofactor cytidylyltransferase
MTGGIIILAAGSSSRMGRPKQLMHYRGKSLVRLVADEARANEGHLVTVVLGANAEPVAKELADAGVYLVANPEWQSGMASSIRVGLRRLLAAAPDTGYCIIAVCDQPYINAAVFEGLKSTQGATGKGIVASGYGGAFGVPALFTDAYFDALLQLTGQEGAKVLIRQHEADVAIYPFEQGNVDIDTMADYNRLSDPGAGNGG